MHAIMALVWCGAVAARPMTLPCPMGGHGAGHDATVISHVGHTQHTGVGTAKHAPTEQPADAPLSHPCDCLGHCCATAVVAPLADSHIVAVIEPPVGVWYPTSATTPRDTRTPFVLPLAMAPPARTLPSTLS